MNASRRVTLVRVEEDAEEEAWEWLLRHDDREYSFVDSTSFAVVRRRRLREALAFDSDFTSAGHFRLRLPVGRVSPVNSTPVIF